MKPELFGHQLMLNEFWKPGSFCKIMGSVCFLEPSLLLHLNKSFGLNGFSRTCLFCFLTVSWFVWSSRVWFGVLARRGRQLGRHDQLVCPY